MLARGDVPTITTGGTLLEAYRRAGDTVSCAATVERLVALGVDPGPVSYNILVAALAEARSYTAAMDIVAGQPGAFNYTADVIRYESSCYD
jgi:hypothetical protein